MSTTTRRIVTVARLGASMANFRSGGTRFSVPIYCTAVYEARPRRRDGKLTWRRVRRACSGTAGQAISGPMVRDAQAYAERNGLPFALGIRHGMPVVS